MRFINVSGDHPRGCGEHLIIISIPHTPTGSSPRMRGAHTFDELYRYRMRIIPADAGSTAKYWDVVVSWEDHPRGCGEHDFRLNAMAERQGSSPRMRGALITSWPKRSSIRIIPADAGSTLDSPCRRSLSRGSSPRMRGARLHLGAVYCSGRIIPADAGSTSHMRDRTCLRGDHPRGCGEHLGGKVVGFHFVGSSPRMRGAPEGFLRSRRWGRIIPADAGSTRSLQLCRLSTRDHPRGCGEHCYL